MELLKPNDGPAKYEWKDGVVFLYRTKVTTEDKYNVDTAGSLMKDGAIQFNPWDFYRALIRQFVTGWEGVTENGKPVPYSYDAFMRLPADPGQDIVMKLAIKIGQDTGFFKSVEEQKKADDLKND
jgi:hypothetical protein